MRNKIAILLGMILASSVAIAAENQKFEELDSDGNGQLSPTEAAQAGVDAQSADTDGDGAISKEEYQAAVEGEPKEGES